MIRKSLRACRGIKDTSKLNERKRSPHKHHLGGDGQQRINKCLSCTKSAKECKGDCFDKKTKGEN